MNHEVRDCAREILEMADTRCSRLTGNVAKNFWEEIRSAAVTRMIELESIRDEDSRTINGDPENSPAPKSGLNLI